MAKALIMIIAAMFTAAAWAGFGSVVSSFPVRDIYATALAHNGTYVVSNNAGMSGDGYWRVWSDEGSVISSFCPPWREGIVFGAAFDGTYYWGGSIGTGYVYRLATTGSVISSFFAAEPLGLTWDGRNLWANVGPLGGSTFRRYTTAGSLVSSFQKPPPIEFPQDLGWDGAYLWCPNLIGYVYRLTTAGTVVASFAPPAVVNTRGCTFDGAYLRLSGWPGGSEPMYIYKIDIGPAPAVAPASLGKVKALFR